MSYGPDKCYSTHFAFCSQYDCIPHAPRYSEFMRDDYLLTEPPFKAILLFSLPMMLGNFFQQFYTMADSVIVGRFVGENALAAVGASYALTTVFISIAIGGGAGASVSIHLDSNRRRSGSISTDCSHRRACGVLVDRLAPCPYTILRLWDYGCRPEHLNCRPSTILGTLAAGFCLSAGRDSQLPHIISIFLLSLLFLLLKLLYHC